MEPLRDSKNTQPPVLILGLLPLVLLLFPLSLLVVVKAGLENLNSHAAVVDFGIREGLVGAAVFLIKTIILLLREIHIRLWLGAGGQLTIRNVVGTVVIVAQQMVALVLFVLLVLF